MNRVSANATELQVLNGPLLFVMGQRLHVTAYNKKPGARLDLNQRDSGRSESADIEVIVDASLYNIFRH